MSESNIILAIVGFSSAGKDTLAKYAHDNLGYNFVVSHSTRPMRAGGAYRDWETDRKSVV